MSRLLKLTLVFGVLVSSSLAQAYARLEVSPRWVNLQAQVGSSSFTESIRVTNYGDEPATFMRVYDNCFMEFYVNDNCYLDLRPGQSCSINVRFQPRREGYHSCDIQVSASNVLTERINVNGRAYDRRMTPIEDESAEQE